MTTATLFSTTKKYLITALLPFLALCAMLTATPVWASESVIASVPFMQPSAIAVNAVTNKIYVTNRSNDGVTVIDGITHSSIKITTGAVPNELDAPIAIAANQVTNKIYVTNFRSYSVTVIDGATNGVTTVTVGYFPSAIAVNPTTNKIYVVSTYGTATVIDGATNSTTTVKIGDNSKAIAVNPVTNKIYVASATSHTVTVIDGATNGTTTVSVGLVPLAIEVNPVTNKIYVANAGSDSVTVIDGATNGTTTVPVGKAPKAIAVNQATNKIYVANTNGNDITVIDGVTNRTTTTAGARYPNAIVVNPNTNKIYVKNHGFGSSIMVIDGTTDAVSGVFGMNFPAAIALNPVTNRVYVSDAAYPGYIWVIGELNTDNTPPSIGASQTPLANASGWNNTDVTVNFTATDAVSTPICTVNSAILAAEGTGQVVSTTCTDVAGNSASASLTINIDKTAPALTMPSLDSSYMINNAISLTFGATDTQSQLASVTATLNGAPVSSGSTVVLNQMGTNTFTLTATDKAGNTATQTQEFTVTYEFSGVKSQSKCNQGVGNGPEGCDPGKSYLFNPLRSNDEGSRPGRMGGNR